MWFRTQPTRAISQRPIVPTVSVLENQIQCSAKLFKPHASVCRCRTFVCTNVGGSGDVLKEDSRKPQANERHITVSHIALAPDRAIGVIRITGLAMHNANTTNLGGVLLAYKVQASAGSSRYVEGCMAVGIHTAAEPRSG